MKMRILWIDAKSQKTYEREHEATGPIDLGVKLHSERETWKHPPLSPDNIVLIARGPFTLQGLIGAHRLVAVFRSPVSMGLHASTLGGAAYALARTGLHGIAITGRSPDPLIVNVIGGENGYEVEIEALDRVELQDVYSGYKGYKGTRALHLYLAEKYQNRLEGLEYRILLVGPAAWTTRFAGIFSWVNDTGGRPSPVVDSASRGGGGSVLAQGHGVAAIIVGGPRNVRIDREPVKLVEKILGTSYVKEVLRTTTKYRYDAKLGTGGTFGVNYVYYRELIPALAYNTIYMSRAVRLLLHEKIIKHFWRPFQELVFEGRQKPWRTCGEPCSVACKKVWNGVKLDYEPAHGMGPMIGVITLEDSARLVELVDDLGLDAIEAGHIVAWLFDAITKGLLSPEDLGVKERPCLDPLALTPESSKINAELARSLLESIASREGRLQSMIAIEGARRTAIILDEEAAHVVRQRGLGFKDLLVYAAFGEGGYMTPNYYWTPGMIAPLYVLGRYWTNYSPTYEEPEEYAEHSLQRATLELLIDNAGICRFHRKWAEKILEPLYKELGYYSGDLKKHALSVYKEIAKYNIKAGAEPVPWESKKTMDIVATIAAELGAEGWETGVGNKQKLLDWWNRFYGRLKDLLEL